MQSILVPNPPNVCLDMSSIVAPFPKYEATNLNLGSSFDQVNWGPLLRPILKSKPPPTLPAKTSPSPVNAEAVTTDEFNGLQIVTAAIVPEPATLVTGPAEPALRVNPNCFKLPTSKSPIMEAMVYCAIHKWGIEISENDKTNQRVVFRVTDFDQYYKQSCSVCSKQTPSDDVRSRMKALQRWFISFPSRKDLAQAFTLTVKTRQFRKVTEIIDKVTNYPSRKQLDC